MSNRRIANQLIARMKFNGPTGLGIHDPLLPTTPPPVGKRSAFQFLLDVLHGVLQTQANGVCDALPGPSLAWLGTQLKVARIRRCLMYQSSRCPDDVLLQETCRWWREQPATGRFVLPIPTLGRPLTPRVYMTGWPDWLVAVGFLLALSRRTWVYTVLMAARDPSAGWLNRLLELCSTIPDPGPNRDALFRSVRDLELLAYELEDAGEAAMRGRPYSPMEEFLAGIAERFPNPLGCADWADVAHQGLQGWGPSWADARYPRLTATLNALAGFKAAELAATLVEFCAEATTFAGSRTLLFYWRGTGSDELRGEKAPPDVAAAVRLVPRSTAALNPDVVLEVEELTEIMLGKLGDDDNTPQAAIIAGLLLGDAWVDIVSKLVSWMFSPRDLTNTRLTAALERLTIWRDWAIALGGRSPVFPPSAPIDQHYWLFLEVLPALWVSPPTAIDAAIACIDRWRPNPGGRPATWAAVTAPEEEPVRAVLGSLYLDEVIGCLIACYHERRSTP